MIGMAWVEPALSTGMGPSGWRYRHRTRALLGRALSALLLPLLLTACATRTNYLDPAGPRSVGPIPGTPALAEWRQQLMVASFNIQEGLRLDSALAVINGQPEIRDADILLLQEMDSDGAQRIAQALGMGWVYYAGAERRGREFGNAILSRWPIVEHEKLILPHLSIFGGMQRIATAVTILVGKLPVRVYSVHLSTPVNLWQAARRDQLRAVLHDASTHPRVVIGGDFNSGALPEMAVARGYTWPTEEGPRTVLFGRWDHIVMKGFDHPTTSATGTVEDNRNASDHRPVWAAGIIR